MVAHKKLFEAVYAKPNDETPRIVLGDALLESGDPRGELIAEQRRSQAKKLAAPTKLERALIKEHGDDWLGPLAEVLRLPTFRLGFVSSATLKGGSHDFSKLRERPEWRTIEKLSILPVAKTAMAAELVSVPQLVSLREVAGLNAEVLSSLAKNRTRVGCTSLTGFAFFGGATGFSGLDALAENANVFPKLNHLGIAGSGMMELEFDVFETLLGSPLMKRLRSLELNCDEGALQQVLDAAIDQKLSRLVMHSWGDIDVTWDAKTKTLTAPKHAPIDTPRGAQRAAPERRGR